MTNVTVAQLAIVALVVGLTLIVAIVLFAEKRRERIRREWVADRLFNEPTGDWPNVSAFHSPSIVPGAQRDHV